MIKEINHFEDIKKWKNEHIREFLTDTNSLNGFHDSIMRKVFEIALRLVTEKFGETPCEYSWFVMGSAGRYEQGIFSDQDHGIVYEKTCEQTASYFKKLGEQLAEGLNFVGYPYCEGNVMSSNALWCKSLEDWNKQLLDWMRRESWESIRYLQIFFDSRSLIGNEKYIDQLRDTIFKYTTENPKILLRFLDNIMNIKHSVGPLGQIFVEDKGPHRGSVDLKKSAFIPYVNAIRLLAINNGLKQTSTLSRINTLCENKNSQKDLIEYEDNFKKLLNYRLNLFEHVHSYDDLYYLSINTLSRTEKNEIKKILKDGKKLLHYVQGKVEKGCL